MATLHSEIWQDDNKLRQTFSWLTRIGAAPKFGTRPIGWYQQDQCNAIAELERLAMQAGMLKARLGEVRLTKGLFEARYDNTWLPFARLRLGSIEAI